MTSASRAFAARGEHIGIDVEANPTPVARSSSMQATKVHVHLFYGADPRTYRKGENIEEFPPELRVRERRRLRSARRREISLGPFLHPPPVLDGLDVKAPRSATDKNSGLLVVKRHLFTTSRIAR